MQTPDPETFTPVDNFRYIRGFRGIEPLITAVKAYCQKYGITQAHFGRMLGVKRAQFNDWMSGRKIPGGDKVLQMQILLKTKPRR